MRGSPWKSMSELGTRIHFDADSQFQGLSFQKVWGMGGPHLSNLHINCRMIGGDVPLENVR